MRLAEQYRGSGLRERRTIRRDDVTLARTQAARSSGIFQFSRWHKFADQWVAIAHHGPRGLGGGPRGSRMGARSPRGSAAAPTDPERCRAASRAIASRARLVTSRATITGTNYPAQSVQRVRVRLRPASDGCITRSVIRNNHWTLLLFSDRSLSRIPGEGRVSRATVSETRTSAVRYSHAAVHQRVLLDPRKPCAAQIEHGRLSWCRSTSGAVLRQPASAGHRTSDGRG